MLRFIYLIQLYPKHAPHIFKFGYTKSVSNRLNDHRTLAPTLKLVASWEGTFEIEQRIVQRLTQLGMIIGGEVVVGDEQEIQDIIKEELNGYEVNS